MEHVILHSDLNCYYASVEMNENPALRGRKVAVCGSTEDRHGIVLTASYPAKRCGVKTGMTTWQAKKICPDLICIQPHYDLYFRYSAIVREIYKRYTDNIEPFGMDECWIDLGYCKNGCEDGLRIAEEIRHAVKEETGLTVSIGVSYTKIFAKLGSDMKKPDAITVIDCVNFKEKVWPLAVSELLYVGHSTTKKLMNIGIITIGDLACANVSMLNSVLGKNGVMLWCFANGTDHAKVKPCDYIEPVKSIGHGTTCVSDLTSEYEVWLVLLALSQDIGHRLLKHEMKAGGVQILVKDKDLDYRQYQTTMSYPTQDPLEIAMTGFDLFQRRYQWHKPVRALTIRGINLVSDKASVQIDIFNDYEKRDKRQRLDVCIDNIRRRFGNDAICAACLMGDLKMTQDRCETVLMPGKIYI